MNQETIQIILEAVNKANAEFQKVIQGTNAVAAATQRSATIQERANVVMEATGRAFNRVRLAAAAATAAVVLFTRHVLNEVDSLSKEARALETTTEKLSALKYAADLGGVGSREMSVALNELARAMEEASGDPAGKAADAFRTISIATNGLRNRDVIEVFYQMADAFERSSGAATKADIAQQLLGGRGRQLIDFMNGGSKAIKDQAAELEKLGYLIHGKTAKDVEDFNDNVTRMQYAFKGVALTVLSEMLPGLNKLVSGLIEVGKNQETVSTIAGDFVAVLTALGKVAVFLYGGLRLIGTIVGGVLYLAFLQITTTGKALVQIFIAMGRGVLDLGNALVDTVKKFANFGQVISLVLHGQFKEAATAAKEALGQLGDSALNIGRSLGKTWEEIGGVVVDTSGKIVDNITETAGAAFDEILKTAQTTSAALDALSQTSTTINVEKGGGKDDKKPLRPDDDFPLQLSLALDRLKARYEDFNTLAKGSARTIAGAFSAAFDSIGSGISDLIKGTETWAGALQRIGTSIMDAVISGITQMFAAWVMGRLLTSKVSQQASIQEGQTDTAAKAPGAVLTSISSWGIAAGVGLAAVIAALAAAGSFAGGGFTGSGGKYEPAGIVHRGEVVIPAETVNKLGVGHFASYFGGSLPGYSAGGFVQPFVPPSVGSAAKATSGANNVFSFAEIKTRNELRDFLSKEGTGIIIDRLNRRGNHIRV